MSVSPQINCLSSEFTEKKHGSRALLLEMGGLTSLNPPGGEKGAPLHLVLDCYMAEEDRIGQHVHKALCLLKVFKVRENRWSSIDVDIVCSSYRTKEQIESKSKSNKSLRSCHQMRPCVLRH